MDKKPTINDVARIAGVSKRTVSRVINGASNVGAATREKIQRVVDELVGSMTAETGLPEPRVRGETGRTSAQLRMFAGLVEAGNWVDARIDRAQPERQPLPKPDLRSMLRPVGPVAVFCASNFPLAFSVAGGDSASAWAAGCPVIVKAHHAHPATALIVGRAVVESVRACGLPEGAFSLIFGEKTISCLLFL